MFNSFDKNVKLFFAGIALLFLLTLSYAAFTGMWLIACLPAAILVGLYFIPNIELPFHLLLLVIPLSFPLSKVLPIEMDFPDEALQLIVTALMLFYFIKKKETYDWGFLKHPLTILVVASFVWTLVCTLASANVGLSAKFLAKKIWYLVPFFFFAFGYFFKKKNISIGFWLMFASLTTIVISVMYKAKGVGFSFTDVHDPIQPFFINHVMYGSMISCFFFAILGAYWTGRKGSVYRLVLLGSLFLYLIAIYFSYSRGAWGALIFGLGMMLAVRLKIAKYAMPIFYTVALIFVLWMAQDNRYLQYRPRFEKTIMHEDLMDHLMATIQGTDISSAERYYRWIATMRMSQDYPVFGVGPNMFYDNYPTYGITEYKTWVSRNIERSTTHNYFLFMLGEQGYIGMLLYAALVFVIFWRSQRIYYACNNKRDKQIILAVIGMLAAVFVNNFFSELLETDKVGSLFYMGVAILVAYDIKNKRKLC